MTPQYTSEALRDLAAFLPIMTAPDFKFVHNDSPFKPIQGGYTTVGYDYDPQVWKLLDVLYDHGWVYEDKTFQWSRWIRNKEALRLLYNSDALAQAKPRQLAKLLTVFARQERYGDGAMLSFWQSGLLLGVLSRVAALSQQGEGALE